MRRHHACRALREELYRANITRASGGDIDNSPIIDQILTLRAEKAKLLGYPNHAEVSMASKVGVQGVQGGRAPGGGKVCVCVWWSRPSYWGTPTLLRCPWRPTRARGRGCV